MYTYLQRLFSFCETPESKSKLHVFDTTVVLGCGMYEKLVNENEIYGDVSKFHCQGVG